MAQRKLHITQIGSGIRQTKRQVETLKALGLGRIGRTVEQDETPSTVGMLRKVSHLVSVREAGK